MESLIHPAILYTCLALGAVGVLMALPRKGGGPQLIGGILAAAFFGLLVLWLAVKAGPDRPNVFFYVFGLIALGASLRVITHPRPVYAALYFILTIISSAALYLLLSAEFMTFALVIIYAGAILITYLFVIMLATEAPSAEATESLKEYDAVANEPVAATAMGFALLGVLTGMMAFGIPKLPAPPPANPDAVLEMLPRKVEREFARIGLMEGARPMRPESWVAERVRADKDEAERWSGFNASNRTARLVYSVDAAEVLRARIAATAAAASGQPAAEGVEPLAPEVFALIDPELLAVTPLPIRPPGEDFAVLPIRFPEGLRAENIELVGFALLKEHPLAIELAGVILLLAMVGAVVLARKQIEARPVTATIGETVEPRAAA